MAKSLRTPAYEHLRSLMIAARRAGGMTQVEVAERLGRPQSFVAKYEGGERRLDVVEFVEVCQALCVDPHSILDALRAGPP
jgi:transcriptional regulator with XRE-family HTH domain